MSSCSWGEACVQEKWSIGPPWPHGGGLEESFGLKECGLMVSCAEGSSGLEEERKPNGMIGGADGTNDGGRQKDIHSVDGAKTDIGGLEDALVEHKMDGGRVHDTCEEVGKGAEDKLSDLGFILEEENVTVDNVLVVEMPCDGNFSDTPGGKGVVPGVKVGRKATKVLKKKCPPVAVRQSARIKRDGIPIHVKAKQRADQKDDISVEEAGSGATVGGGGSVLCLAACNNRPNSKGGSREKRQRSVI
ncbi:hypothetical protein GUJ93_ZPchr2171g28982 [Zizania palustris]|uniref:Uncharacterized protein n=1 Tax=Zizania palustris TaxID=103762 RepID=A0A8J5VE59_ZIZPA|nr:hypothetical protein GUJ93_ZPchr2171g28982 [Zizania palustris]